MRRTIHAIVASAAVLTAVACGDNAVSPTASAKQSAPTAADFSAVSSSLSLLSGSGYDFVITPAGGNVNVGGLFTLNFPANAVCDPSTSGYGPGTWDAPCTPANGAIFEHATVSATSQGIRVDFSNPIRFVPSQNVTISTTVFANLLISAQSYLNGNMQAIPFLTIQYDPSLTGQAVNDAATDPSVRTYVNLSTGTLSRRIKHFSGYGVIVDDGYCDPNLPGDPDCQTGPQQGQ